MVANAFIGSRLDYSNSLIKNFYSAGLCKLQYIQNSLATIDCKATKYPHITPKERPERKLNKMIKVIGLRQAWKHFLQECAIMAANVLVSSRLNYCNA